MRRFLVQVIKYIVVVAIITCFINCIYIKMEKSDADYTDRFKSIPSSIMVCNFGSSHGLFGFDYEDVTGVECFNFAFESQSLSYDSLILENYKGYIAKGAVVFIPVTYPSLYGGDETMESDFENKNKRYYKILPPEKIKEYDFKTDIYVNYFPALTAKDYLIKVLMGQSKNWNDEIWSGEVSEDGLIENAQLAYERHLVKNKVDSNGNRIINQKEIEALKQMIEECKRIGATPILITTPFTREYTDIIEKEDPGFFLEFKGMIQNICNDMDVKYMDYSCDERFINDYTFFMDSDHLNKKGARRFVSILMDEVVEAEY